MVGLLEVVDGGPGDPVAEQQGKPLSEQHPQHRQHRHSPVLELGLPVELKLLLRDVVGEAQGVEEAEGGGGAGVGGGLEAPQVGDRHHAERNPSRRCKEDRTEKEEEEERESGHPEVNQKIDKKKVEGRTSLGLRCDHREGVVSSEAKAK